MISTNTLSVFLLHNHLSGLGNKNLRSIQDVMRASKLAAEKFKRVCKDFPNIAILTKSSTSGKIHEVETIRECYYYKKIQEIGNISRSKYDIY